MNKKIQRPEKSFADYKIAKLDEYLKELQDEERKLQLRMIQIIKSKDRLWPQYAKWNAAKFWQ